MSGLFALLDDVAAIAKVAAASLDDVAAAAYKAGSKAAGVVIDDAAVTPKYVTGMDPKRELPMIWRIAVGSLRNKFLLVLPVLILLDYFLPQLITPILMLGGAFLCFEGAEKVLHLFQPAAQAEAVAPAHEPSTLAQLEETRVSGAVRTDLILSAEIMTIALSAIPEAALWVEILTLAIVAIGVTAGVYGAVAVIVKMDDIGMRLAQIGKLGAMRALGRGLVQFMPWLLQILSVVGTLAMLWVGGSIIIHGLEEFHIGFPGHEIAAFTASVTATVGPIIGWIAMAALQGVFGLIIGGLVVLVVEKLLAPLLAKGKGA